MSGIVIVFDGPDGVGKTTQLELTARWLRSEGRDVYTTRASGGTEIGEALRAASLSDAPRPAEVDVYISLAMHTAVGMDINERRTQDTIILVDRSPMALVAYNIFGGQLKNTAEGYAAYEKLMKLWHPDLCLYVDAPQLTADERRASRQDKPSDYFEKQDGAFHQRVRTGYQEAMKRLKAHPEWRGMLVEIDGQPPQEKVQQSIQQVVNKVL